MEGSETEKSEKEEDKLDLIVNLLRVQNELLAKIDTELKEIYNELHWYAHRLK